MEELKNKVKVVEIDGEQYELIPHIESLTKIFDIMDGTFRLKPMTKLITLYEIKRDLGCPTILHNGFHIEKMTNRLEAIRNLFLVAKYLNGDWKPENFKRKYAIVLMIGCNLEIQSFGVENYGNAVFKTKELAEQAIEILGEESIILSYSYDA